MVSFKAKKVTPVVFAVIVYCIYLIYNTIFDLSAGVYIDFSYEFLRGVILYWSFTVAVLFMAIFSVSSKTRMFCTLLLLLNLAEGSLYYYLHSLDATYVFRNTISVITSLVCFLILKYLPMITYYASSLVYRMGKITWINNGLRKVRDLFGDREGIVNSLIVDAIDGIIEYKVARKIGTGIADAGTPSYISLLVTRILKYYLIIEFSLSMFIYVYAYYYPPIDGSVYSRIVLEGHPDFFIFGMVFTDIISICYLSVFAVSYLRERNGKLDYA